MIRVLTTTAFIAGIATLSSCLESSFDRDYDTVTTLVVSEISASGVTLNGRIESEIFGAIEEAGFIYNIEGVKMDDPLNKYVRKISADLSNSNKNYSFRVTNALDPGRVYQVRAYIKQGERYIYGNTQFFTSIGANPMLLKSVAPTVALEGDTITILGENLVPISQQGGILLINFDGTYPVELSRTETEIKAIVPDIITRTTSVPWRLEFLNQETNAVSTLLPPPEVSEIEPSLVGRGDTITISGKYFSIKPHINKLYFNNHECDLISSSRTKLVFRISRQVVNDKNIRLAVSNRFIDLTGRIKLK